MRQKDVKGFNFMNKTRILKCILLLTSCLTVLFIYFGCGGSKASEDNTGTPIRTGTKLESISVQYSESNPNISAAGDKITFVSGKLLEGQTAPILKSYKVDWADASAPAAAEE